MKKELSEKVIDWTRNWFAESSRKTAVIGISGGKDSAVVAAICAKALGPENVVGVLMPNGEQTDIEDSWQVVNELGIRSYVVNIKDAYVDMREDIGKGLGMDVSEGARINIAPRIRMTVLYAVAQTLSEAEGAKACVVGTGNRSEAEVGYTTKWGDSACDVNPIRNLWCDEVIQVGDEMGYFPNIIHKIPSDGLCGKTDEDRLGVSYDDIKAVFTGRPVSDEAREKVEQLHRYSEHKRQPIPSYRKGE